MLIIPAIDIQDGCVVRFVQGKLDKRIYSRDPLKTARHWLKQGAKLIHIVDLDGAFTGLPKNIAIVKQIAKELPIPVQFGGGVREISTIRDLLDNSVSRVVLGTKAVQDKGFLAKAFKEFKDKIIVSIDAKADDILIKGWQETSKQMKVTDFVFLLKGTGLSEIIYTDILKDGTLKGPNIKSTKSLLKDTGIKIIASAGVSTLEDLRKLKSLEKDGLIGVIVGKALYEGRFTLTQALKFV